MNLISNERAALLLRRRAFGLAPAIVAAMTLMSATSNAAPTARLEASRTSGPAPLAVMFDATGTTDSSSSVDTFRQTGYRFDFADAGSGTWAHSSLPKNEQIGGPLAAHVFERAGTYVVRVTAKDAAGAISSAAVTITVTSPDSAFPGTQTVCISRTSDFSGCPSGAQQIANASSWPTFASSRRYLLRAGQDFSSLGGIALGRMFDSGLSDTQVGSFGSGAKPVVARVDLFSSAYPTSTNRGWPERVTVWGLDSSNIGHQHGGTDLLLFRNELTRGGSITLTHAFAYQLNAASSSNNGWQVPRNLFVVENNIRGTGNNDSLTGQGYRLALLGNLVERTNQHNVRLWQGHKVVVAHNRLNGISQDPYRTVFKMHSAGLSANQLTLSAPQQFSQRSAELVFANNIAGSASNNQQWLVSVSPQNGEYAEGVEKAIFEDNTFVVGTNHSLDIAWGGRNMTERGNRNTSYSAPRVGLGHYEGLPSDWRGPYYANQQSMRTRFASGTVSAPNPPTLRVE